MGETVAKVCRYEGCWLTVKRFDGQDVVVDRCLECGAMVLDRDEHDRFHAILNHQGKAIAVLINAHLTERTHARYDVRERIGENPNNWSAEAMAEVVADIEAGEDHGRGSDDG